MGSRPLPCGVFACVYSLGIFMTVADRVRELVTFTGTKGTTTTITLPGSAASGYDPFSRRYSTGAANIPVVIAHRSADEWQACYCTYSSANTLTVDEIVATSDAADASPNFSAGDKDIYVAAISKAFKVSRFDNTGLKVLDTNASHTLTIAPGSNLTADRTLTITTGDAARTLTLTGDASLTGTNSGDQTITLTGDVTGSGTGSFATAIGAGVIVDADVNASAAIAGTKLAFTQTGTGASSRTVDAKLKDGWVSVKDFGATGDGVTNDTTAINNAIAAVNTAGGGVVYFPPGTYATTTGITLGNGSASAPSTKDNRIRLVGASYGSTTGKINQQVNGSSRLLFAGTASLTANLLYFQGPMYGVGVENLTLDCDNKAGRGLLVNHVTQGTFHRVSCRNYTEAGFYLTTQSANPVGAAFGCADNRFTDCYGFLDNQAADTEGTATGSQTSTTLADTGKTWTTNEWTNYQVRIVSGTGSGQTRTISSNTATALTVSPAWTTTPVAGSSVYRIEGTIRGIILTSGVSTGTDLAGQPDSARNVFIGGTYFYGCTSESHGAWLNGADNNAFIEVQFLPRHSVTTGYDVYLQQWTANGAFPLENYFSNLGMTRGVAGNGDVGSSYGNTFFPFPTSDGATGLATVTGISGGDHKGKSYVAGKRAYRGRQIIRVDDSTTRSTTSTSETDLTGYSTTITTLADTKLKVTLSVWAAKSTTSYGYFYINVGGSDDAVSELRVGADGYYSSRVTVGIIDVGAGTHTVKIRFKSGDGTSIDVLKGFMIVEELY